MIELNISEETIQNLRTELEIQKTVKEKSNKEKKEKSRKKQRAYSKEYSKSYRKSDKYKLSHRKSALKRIYGITFEEYNKMYNEQEGKCLICKKHQSEFKRLLSVDHNHETGKIRGLLCNRCNVMIGLAYENIEILKEAVKYLSK